MSKASKWYILYLRIYHLPATGEPAARIECKEFSNELDLLVWAGKSRIPKAHGQHYMVSPDGVGRHNRVTAHGHTEG